MTSLYEILKSAKLGAGAAQDFHTAIMAQKMPFAKGSGAEHEYTGAVPVTFTANGQPLLDYLISGNTTQNGTPTPDNPIQPQETGERTGNLIPEYPAQTKMLDGVNWNVSSNGKITGNGTTTSGTNFYLLSNYSIPLKAGTYTLSFVGRKNISLILRNVTTLTTICSIWSTNSSATFAIDDDIPETDRINLYFNASQAGTSVDVDGYPMLNLGSTPLPYQPYGIKIPISSAGQTTPIYLGEVETTRRVKKLVLTGQEGGAWSYNQTIRNGNGFYNLSIFTGYKSNSGAGYCSHYPLATAITATIGVFFDENINFITNFSEGIDTADKWKSYLQQQYAAGTPVTVWYVLAEPETGIVNEPLMRIGNYADTLSHAQAGVQIPTANDSTTLDVETAVKPSEVYIKYKS